MAMTSIGTGAEMAAGQSQCKNYVFSSAEICDPQRADEGV